LRRLATLALALAGLVALVPSAAAAPSASPAAPSQAVGDGPVDVIEVSGWLDPVLVDFVEQSVDRVEGDRSVALVLQLDSPGALVGEERLERLLTRLGASEVTIGVWIGPSGASAYRDAARIVDAADVVGLAPGSKVEIDGRRLNADAALEAGVADVDAPTIGDFIVQLPGVESREVRSEVERDGRTETLVRLEPVTPTRFTQLSLVSQLLHTVASPAVAYLLFVIGMALLVFELFTAGIGIAGVVGATCFVLGTYGLAVLPTTGIGVGLLVLAMFGYAIDIQTGVPRVWTGVATVAFVVGSLTLYDGIELSWITLLIAILGMTLAMLAGMPAMVRTRFSTPTIGREWMVGERGVAQTAIAPDGVVVVRDAPWRARTNRATPIAEGDVVRVAAIDRLVLEVEPLVGAARDHRDGKGRGDAAQPS
jgi:membrane-bound serine protease (ClpP class)